MRKPRYAGTIMALLVASTLLATAAPARPAETPGGVCIVPRAPGVAHAAAPAPAPRIVERVHARVLVQEEATRRTVERQQSALSARAAGLEARLAVRLAARDARRGLVDDAVHVVKGDVVRLELADAFAVELDDDHGTRFDPELEFDAGAWRASHDVCRVDRTLAGGLDLLVHVAKAPARGVGLVLDAVVTVAKVVPTILRALV